MSAVVVPGSGAKWLSTSLRWLLWGLLAVLVVALLGTVVWLAGRYETSQMQANVERDAADAISDIRSGLTRNVQTLQALQSGDPTPQAWAAAARQALREHREWVRLEWRDTQLATLAFADTPYRAPVFERLGRANSNADVQQACVNSRRINSAAYARSYFVPQSDGLGLEVMELCLAQVSAGRLTGYLIATYALSEMLAGMIGPTLTRSHEVSFTEADGTRLAMQGAETRRGSRVFTGTQLLDLPGNTMVLRMDAWRAAPDMIPNLLTALVTGMSIALITVLFMLAHDMRRRLRAEQDLADALAFRKAMEDSLVTGLRARDLQGRTTYVNPAFCQMVGFSAEQITTQHPPPYWPPEHAAEYGKRQAVRLAGNSPPREGFESTFMRRSGERFPVLIIEAPLINAHGTQTGWMSAVLDISEQRRVEELSRASQERLQATARLATVGEMASLLSHELNQPLAAIASYATGSMNLLKSGSDSNFVAAVATRPDTELMSSIEMAMQRISEQAERAGRVIKSVHDFVRRRDKEREEVAPQALVDAILPLVNLQARKLGVRVETKVPAALPHVLCDRTMVEQVLLNLARNAMQAMDEAHVEDPWLLIEAKRAGASESGKAWIEFSVADCGPGIPEEVKQQLFTPFFTTKDEGMGLGLSLCRTVVEQHGGFLQFDPRKPQGTIFRFTLPAVANA